MELSERQPDDLPARRNEPRCPAHHERCRHARKLLPPLHQRHVLGPLQQRGTARGGLCCELPRWQRGRLRHHQTTGWLRERCDRWRQRRLVPALGICDQRLRQRRQLFQGAGPQCERHHQHQLREPDRCAEHDRLHARHQLRRQSGRAHLGLSRQRLAQQLVRVPRPHRPAWRFSFRLARRRAHAAQRRGRSHRHRGSSQHHSAEHLRGYSARLDLRQSAHPSRRGR